LPRSAVHLDEASSQRHDLIHNRKAKSPTLGALRRKERVEHALARRVAHPLAVVDHFDHHEGALTVGGLPDRLLPDVDRDNTACRHRITRVHH